MALSTFPTHLVYGPDSVGRACCEITREGQTYMVSCVETGVEMIWSPSETGTLDAATDEHTAAHRDALKAKQQREDFAANVAHARWLYRNTEPNDPARRGINAYAAYL